jgi:transposase
LVQNRVSELRLILAIDVAKEDMVAALTTSQAEVVATLTWKHLEQTPVLLEKLEQLRALGYSIEAVMESTGTYGDVLRHQLQSTGVVVYQVNGKRAERHLNVATRTQAIENPIPLVDHPRPARQFLDRCQRPP